VALFQPPSPRDCLAELDFIATGQQTTGFKTLLLLLLESEANDALNAPEQSADSSILLKP